MKRVGSALVLGSAVVLTVLWAPAFAGTVLTAVFSVVAVIEISRLAAGGTRKVPVSYLSACAVAMLFAAWAGGLVWLYFAFTVSVVFLFAHIVLAGESSGTIMRNSQAVFILVYPALILGHLPLMLVTGYSRRSLLFLLAVIWSCDSAAFFAGKAIGKRKLLESVSPNKTVEGAVAGALAAAVVGLVFSVFSIVEWGAGFSAAVGLIAAVLGQFGDLAESKMKRDAGVKDSGSLIPGHGGVLDRIDALLFALPVFFYIVLLAKGSFG